MRLSSLVGLGLLAVACAPKAETPAVATPAALSVAELDSVKAVDAAFAAAMNAKDTAAVFAIYAADAKLMPPDSPIMDMAAGRQLIVGLLAAGATDFVLTPITTYGIGDLAYTVGTVTYKMNGASETDKYAEVLRKGADGKWHYVADMFSGVAAQAAASGKK